MDRTIHQSPLVSVVMCAYNGLPYIREAVACVVNQTYEHWELIICDDGSNDGTREWLQENYAQNPRVRLFFHQKNMGYVANKNFGHQQARGTYITQLDNDDCCAPDKLEKQISVIQSNPEIKIVASGYYKINEKGEVFQEISSNQNIVLDKSHTEEYPFWFPGLLVHREVFEVVGYFNDYFSGALGDDLYWTKSANRIYPIYCLADKLYSYRNNPNSITNVYGNVRKLIIPEVLKVLLQQQQATGEDWLMQKNFSALKKLEESLIANRSFMAEQYRVWAAKAIDKNHRKLAWKLLLKSFGGNPVNKNWYRTMFYALRNLLTR